MSEKKNVGHGYQNSVSCPCNNDVFILRAIVGLIITGPASHLRLERLLVWTVPCIFGHKALWSSCWWRRGDLWGFFELVGQSIWSYHHPLQTFSLPKTTMQPENVSVPSLILLLPNAHFQVPASIFFEGASEKPTCNWKREGDSSTSTVWFHWLFVIFMESFPNWRLVRGFSMLCFSVVSKKKQQKNRLNNERNASKKTRNKVCSCRQPTITNMHWLVNRGFL